MEQSRADSLARAAAHGPEALKVRQNAGRTRFQRLEDRVGHVLGGPILVVINVVGVAGWLAVNLGGRAFDPYPFPLLQLIASLEAIAIATLVLSAQRRATHTAELRAEVDLHVNTVAEQELTKLLQLVARIAQHVGVEVRDDRELAAFLAPTNVARIEQTIADQIAPGRAAK